MALTHSPLLTTLLTLLLILTSYLFYVSSTLDAALATTLKTSSPVSTSSVRLLDTIPHHLIPTPHNNRRLIVVGDIHGMVDSLNQLLTEVGFDADRDHLVATGDMISKGPKSGAVVDRLIQLGASAVRGNHEDHVLKARAKMDRKKHRKNKKKHHKLLDLFRSGETEARNDDDEYDPIELDEANEEDEDEMRSQRAKARDRQTARALKKHQVRWLRSLPVIISLEPILPIYIVHAGLVPGLQVRKQDPWAVMNMRTLRYPKHKSLAAEEAEVVLQDDQGEGNQLVLIPSEGSLEDDEAASSEPQADEVEKEGDDASSQSHRMPVPISGRSGKRWADAWNQYQRHLHPEKKRRSVIYGHDAKRGHRVGEYTFGLDSGCVVGGKLTAAVIRGGALDGEFMHETVQIPC